MRNIMMGHIVTEKYILQKEGTWKSTFVDDELYARPAECSPSDIYRVAKILGVPYSQVLVVLLDEALTKL